MNVVVMCCVLNEERNIERYCKVYSRFADSIVICDGGSTDRTVELAEGFTKVHIVHFEEQMDLDGILWNPKGKQHNFAYAETMKHKPDWMITDECDSIPTLALQRDIRLLMQVEAYNVIGAKRLYVLGQNRFFPDLSLQGYFGWTHRPGRVDASYGEETPKGLRRKRLPHPIDWHQLATPCALLHYGWPDEETVAFKTKRYRATGGLPPKGNAIPSNAGTPEPLPEWAEWN